MQCFAFQDNIYYPFTRPATRFINYLCSPGQIYVGAGTSSSFAFLDRRQTRASGGWMGPVIVSILKFFFVAIPQLPKNQS